MADNVGISTGTGATVGADDIGGIAFQRVKIILGSDGTNLGDVDVTRQMPVSGTVTVSGTAIVSVVPGVSVNALVTGVVSVSAMPAVSISVSAVLGTIITQLGTQVVTVVPGVSVNVGSQATGIYTTTATSGATGPIVWLGVGQTLGALNTVVTILGTQVVSVVPMPSISTVNTILTILGTQVVTVVPGLSVSAVVSGTVTALLPGSTTGSSGMSGVLVWLGASQTVIISTQVSGTVTVNGSVSVSGTGLVSLVAGASISIMGALNTVVTVLGTVLVSGTVSVVNGVTVNVSGHLITTTGVTTGTAQAVWIMNPTTVTVTITGTTTGTVSLLSIVPVTTQVSVSVSGIPVWFNPGALVAVSGTAVVSLSSAANVTTGITSGMTGIPVWPGQPVNQPFMLMVTSTAIAQSAAAYLFTVWTGATVATAGVSLYVLPAGKALQLQGLEMAVTTSAVVGGTVQVFVVNGVAASFVSASFRTQGLVLVQQIVVTSVTAVSAANLLGGGPIPAAGSMAVMIVASTAAVLQNVVIQGYLF